MKRLLTMILYVPQAFIRVLGDQRGFVAVAGEGEGEGDAGDEGDQGDSGSEGHDDDAGDEGDAGDAGEGDDDADADDDADDEGEEGDEGEESEADKGTPKGKDVPYKRFKNVKRRLSTAEADLADAKSLFQHPAVFKAALEARGVKGAEADKRMREAGFTVEDEAGGENEEQLIKRFGQGLDLKKTENWAVLMGRIAKHYSDKSAQPLMDKLSKNESDAKAKADETEARKLAEDVYKMPYGEYKADEDNPETAVGKMAEYLDDHPEKASYGYTDILKLAMAEEALDLGERRGKAGNRKRIKALKGAGAEGSSGGGKGETPTGDWPMSRILSFMNKNPDKV